MLAFGRQAILDLALREVTPTTAPPPLLLLALPPLFPLSTFIFPPSD